MDEYQQRDLSQLLLTTNHVVEETITLLRSRGHRDPDDPQEYFTTS